MDEAPKFVEALIGYVQREFAQYRQRELEVPMILDSSLVRVDLNRVQPILPITYDWETVNVGIYESIKKAEHHDLIGRLMRLEARQDSPLLDKAAAGYYDPVLDIIILSKEDIARFWYMMLYQKNVDEIDVKTLLSAERAGTLNIVKSRIAKFERKNLTERRDQYSHYLNAIELPERLFSQFIRAEIAALPIAIDEGEAAKKRPSPFYVDGVQEGREALGWYMESRSAMQQMANVSKFVHDEGHGAIQKRKDNGEEWGIFDLARRAGHIASESLLHTDFPFHEMVPANEAAEHVCLRTYIFYKGLLPTLEVVAEEIHAATHSNVKATTGFQFRFQSDLGFY